MNNTMNHEAIMETEHSNETTTNASTNATSTVDLYVVQKCWFAGPQMNPAVDYLRLLTSVTDAEQVAYQSAHLHSSTCKGKVVRTIQLQNSSSGTGYGFVANGTLFWVRKVRAVSTNGDCRVGEAHGVLCDGTVLGEHGQARRTVQQNEHHNSNKPSGIFVGPHSSHAALRYLHEQSPQDAVSRTVRWLPVGPPATVEQLQSEWPDAPCWNNNNNNNMLPVTTESTMSHDLDSGLSSSKRGTENEASSWTIFQKTTTANVDASQQRPAKRTCRADPDSSCYLHEIHRHNETAAMDSMAL